MYRRVNNSRYIVLGISGIVLVMSIFTGLMFGIAKNINAMTDTIVQLGDDVRTMTEVQKVMAQDIGAMSLGVVNMQNDMRSVSHNMTLMTGNTARMSYDVGRTSRMMSSPMTYFWNMQP